MIAQRTVAIMAPPSGQDSQYRTYQFRQQPLDGELGEIQTTRALLTQSVKKDAGWLALIGRCFLEWPLDCLECSDSVARSARARKRRSSAEKSFGFSFWCIRLACHEHHDALR